ncbi:Serine/threonine protein kinase [Candidatus Sulfopaludibacter sp. SbA4]|nr:Serine/threonine protein kinase [Candidatus Sulfopaludibacter sp. SbA4]
MKQDVWRRAEELFHAALERDPEARRAFLNEACGEDAELRQQVEILISNDAHAGSVLERPVPADVTATLANGSLVGRQFGPYRVVSLLGAGGMGEVYRAHDTKLGRDVAIKTLPQEFARDPQRLSRFRREAQTLASLNHPNIGAIFGFEDSDYTDFLVLELVEGDTLRGPLAVERALDYARQVAEALEAAHEKGIIHRDLKPSNVKVTPQGKVKVLDFGLAKAIWGPEGNPALSQSSPTGFHTLAGVIMGTPGYMSPEQARGQALDERTDVWAFGCLLYELLTGKCAFEGETASARMVAVLEEQPDWTALPAKTPAKIRRLLRSCLEKDAALRLQHIADARRTIEEAQRGWNRWRIVAIAAATLTSIGVGAALWLRNPVHTTDSSQWVPVTKFADSATQPTLSPDGRMVTFIRGPSTIIGPGQIYAKILPDGEPVQLTHDNLPKMSPVFSPDGSRIAYTATDFRGFQWDTWVVPALGGEPQLWLKNASGLTWTGPRSVLFSEIKKGIHMGLVATDENRMSRRDVYLPASEPGMAHRSYLSPNGKWVLLVEMDEDHLWEPCRVVPADGNSPGRKVGPPGGGCTSGAWSPDGRWIYLTSNAVGTNHIWRQRFPNGVPQQVTSGLTEEEGVTMAPDGRSFITAVVLQNASLWVHDAHGERQVSPEANASQPKFTPDGKQMTYRIVKEPPSEFGFYRDLGEVRMLDLASGRSEPVAAGFAALDYSLSPNGREVAMETADKEGKPRLWLAALDHSSPPRQIPNVEGRTPRFGPGGEILFRRIAGSRMEGTTGYVYGVRPDGSGLRKVLEQPVFFMGGVTPDRKSLHAWAPLSSNGRPAFQVFPLDGGPPVVLGGAVSFSWSPGGDSVSVSSAFGSPIPEGRSYVIPLARGQILPQIPEGGFRSEAQVSSLPGARRIDVASVIGFVAGAIIPGPSPDVYAFYRSSIQRNLYRVPIP